MKKKILISSALVIMVCLCLIAGSTFALFSETTAVNMVIGSATVDLNASLSAPKGESRGVPATVLSSTKLQFANGGTVEILGNQLIVERMTPGDTFSVTVNVTNHSNITTKCKASTSITGDLASVLDVSYSTKMNLDDNDWGVLQPAASATGDSIGTIVVTVKMPESVGNTAQDKNATISIVVEAIQGNG